MKKLIATSFLLFSFVFITNEAQAQVDFGIRGGVNFATFNDTEADVESKVGLLAGVYLNYHIANSPVSIQPEILYSQKGAESDMVIDGQEVTVKAKYDYIEIPVLAKFDFILDGPVTPHVYFGPYLGINVNAEAEISNGETSIGGEIEDNVKSTDFGVVVGAGIDVNRFNIGARYSVGLTPISDADGADAKNGVISIVAGIGF